jgi:MSHA biogenesis protein MshF
MNFGNFLVRIVVWLIVVMLLIWGVVQGVSKVETNSDNSIMIIAGKNILDRANFYRQYWYVNDKPQQINQEGQEVRFNSKGWVLPSTNDHLGCSDWLNVLHPQDSLFSNEQPSYETYANGRDFACKFYYRQKNVLIMQVINSQFSVNVEFLVEEIETNS